MPDKSGRDKKTSFVAANIADVHFTLHAPACRAPETNWLEYQGMILSQVFAITAKYNVPLIIAGDIFTNWNPQHELVSWVISRFRRSPTPIICIPGNHDIPNHNYKQLPRSAFWTLVEAEAVTYLTPALHCTHSFGPLIISPFPFGFPVTHLQPGMSHDLCINVAVIHDYIWKPEHSVKELETEGSFIKAWRKKIKTYDVAIFGDNHKGFVSEKPGKTTIINCGSLMRTTIDQEDYMPFVTLLRLDGTTKIVYLDVESDLFASIDDELNEIAIGLDVDIDELIEDLRNAQGGQKRDLPKIVLSWARRENAPDYIIQILMRWLAGGRNG